MTGESRWCYCTKTLVKLNLNYKHGDLIFLPDRENSLRTSDKGKPRHEDRPSAKSRLYKSRPWGKRGRCRDYDGKENYTYYRLLENMEIWRNIGVNFRTMSCKFLPLLLKSCFEIVVSMMHCIVASGFVLLDTTEWRLYRKVPDHECNAFNMTGFLSIPCLVPIRYLLVKIIAFCRTGISFTALFISCC